MSTRFLTIGALALVGILAPFYIVKRLLELNYNPDITGQHVPAYPGIIGYACAVLAATLVFYYTSRVLKNDQTPPAPDEPIETEELPE